MTNILIMFIVFMALLFLGIPVVFALGTASLIWLLTMNPVGIPASVAAQTMMSQMLSFALIAMPGFLFVGRMMNTSGVTDRLLKFSVAVVGRYRGGLAHANALASMLFASMSEWWPTRAGRSGRDGYDDQGRLQRDFSADMAASSILGPIIPPSAIMVLVGSISSISWPLLWGYYPRDPVDRGDDGVYCLTCGFNQRRPVVAEDRHALAGSAENSPPGHTALDDFCHHHRLNHGRDLHPHRSRGLGSLVVDYSWYLL